MTVSDPGDLKIAFTGTSGAGKTTLVKWLNQGLGLRHFSGSSEDVKHPVDKLICERIFKHEPSGHQGVISHSSWDVQYGVINQLLLQIRRSEIITQNKGFVTDRSPVDNMTYFVNQCGMHPEVDDEIIDAFRKECLKAWEQLTHVIYIKPCQPDGVENNGSRIANKFYQLGIDAQFQYWMDDFVRHEENTGPEVLVINFWDLEKRKQAILNFLGFK